MANKYITTGAEITTVIANLEKLYEEHREELNLKNIYNYDEMRPSQEPALAIVFNNGTMTPMTLGWAIPESAALGGGSRCGCSVFFINITLFLYLESLNIGRDTFVHLGALNNMAKIAYKNAGLYGLCTQPMLVTNVTLVGRRLATNVYLTGQMDLTVPVRF